MTDLLQGCPDTNSLLRQMPLRKCEQRGEYALVRLAVGTHGRYLSKYPGNLLPGEG